MQLQKVKIIIILPLILAFSICNAKAEIHSLEKNEIVNESQDKTIFEYIIAPFYLLFMFTAMYYDKQQKYNKSFHTLYKTNDYNDSKIRFYKHALEQNTVSLIKAKDMYSYFEYDVKNDLALGCISYNLRQYNDKNWLRQSRNYRKNARNLYANNEKRIDEAKESEELSQKYLHYYNYNHLNHTVEKITSMWKPESTSPCQSTTNLETMYKSFLLYYIADYIPSKKFGKKWEVVLEQNRPKLFAKAKHFKITLSKQRLHDYALNKESKPNIWSIKDSKVYLNTKFKDGQTSLILATINHHEMIILELLQNDVDLNIKDNFGKTALDYANIKTNRLIYQRLKNAEALNNIPKEKRKFIFTF